jgi:putative PIN family toxin of toxin-antitoxin system
VQSVKPDLLFVVSNSSKKIKLAVSTETLVQIREVLSRPVLRKRFPELTEVKAQRLMVLLVNRGMLFRNVHRHYEFSRDPSDECYLNLAMVARADFVVTRDRDFA